MWTYPGGPPGLAGSNDAEEADVLALIVAALIVWVVLAVVGFTIKGLLWLAIIAVVLFVITGALGALRRRR